MRDMVRNRVETKNRVVEMKKGYWTSQAFTDTLRPVRYGFKRLWTDPSQMAVPTSAIIEGLDVVGDLGRSECSGRVDALFDPLLLHAAKKRFGHRVIPAVSPSAHTRLKMMCLAEAPPRITAKLRALI